MALDGREAQQFMNAARIKLPGASDAGIKAELYDVFREFFKDSNSWLENITFQAKAGITDYLLPPLEDGKLIRLIGVWDDKFIPIPAFMPVFGTVALVNAPNTTPTTLWTARVVKNVTLPITQDDFPVVPAWSLSMYQDVILDGLLGRMMGQQNKSYSNSQMSMYHLRRFRTGMVNARVAALRQNVVGAQEWAYPQGFGKGSQRGGVSTAWPQRGW